VPKAILFIMLMSISSSCFCWGFHAHRKINFQAVFLLPPQMMMFYKPHIDFIENHATDPDKRRYLIAAEGARHYIDMDHYGSYPFNQLPRKWKEAVDKFGEDTLQAHGIVPWHIQVMLGRLTKAFKEKNFSSILKSSAELGHYIADAHVPLHTSENYDGQLTNQKGIHAFWESRIPELLDKNFDFLIGKAEYIKDPSTYIWQRILESAKASDSVLKFEKELSLKFRPDKKRNYELRNNKRVEQNSSEYTIAYNKMLNGMVERRMRQSVFAIASFWYTAWVNAGQPDLSGLVNRDFSENDIKEFEKLNVAWKNQKDSSGRFHE
jgi:hypothetical protein